jgi:hypothetical protein
MRLRILGVLASVLVAHGIAAADGGKFGSMSIFERWKQKKACSQCAEPCESCCPPTHVIPSPTLFRAEVGAPTYVPGKSLPPIELVRTVPPNIELITTHPPELPLLRATPPNVELVAGKPPHVPTFRRQPAPLEHAPSVQIPSVTIFQVAQPPTPCCPPPACAPCCSSVGR